MDENNPDYCSLRSYAEHGDTLQHARLSMWVTAHSVFFAFVAATMSALSYAAVLLICTVGFTLGLCWLISGRNIATRIKWADDTIKSTYPNSIHKLWLDQGTKWFGLRIPSWLVLVWIMPILFMLAWIGMALLPLYGNHAPNPTECQAAGVGASHFDGTSTSAEAASSPKSAP